jgi:orotidine 5'-phosphate decarboxylase subfamily 2
MKFVDQLDGAVSKNNSLLCVGLDPDLKRLPQKLLSTKDPIFSFNQSVIDATKDFVCAYKPNSAFYEMNGIAGLTALIKTIEYIRALGLPVILDAKRGDIGNSSAAYATSAFEVLKADAVTVSPYMGHDSVQPFLDHKDKGVFVLCLTSNPGYKDFEVIGCDEPLYHTVARRVKEWNVNGNCGLVVGATKPTEIKAIREIVGDLPILIPGIGAQGGDLELSVKYGGKRGIINASRSILYSADPGAEAKKLRDEINKYRS